MNLVFKRLDLIKRLERFKIKEAKATVVSDKKSRLEDVRDARKKLSVALRDAHKPRKVFTYSYRVPSTGGINTIDETLLLLKASTNIEIKSGQLKGLDPRWLA